MRQFLLAIALIGGVLTANAQRESTLINNDWTFHLGSASSMEADFTHGTEYFTYFAKAVGQNKGPASPEFNDSLWQHVNLPHDWVVDLPYSGEASHSHGYKQVGWKYPQNSIGWYRKHFTVAKEDEGRRIIVRFGGIFRNAQVFCNGFYMGHEPSGYVTQDYDLTEYLNYGGDNVITVRCDASTEEGWYYEGAGIYRNVYLIKTNKVHFTENSIALKYTVNGSNVDMSVNYAIENDTYLKDGKRYSIENILADANGKEVARFTDNGSLQGATLWSLDNPYLYTLTSRLIDSNGNAVDAIKTKVGFRTIVFDNDKGVLLNGKPVILKGSNLHLDHAGVGVGVPDGVWVYKVKKMKELGSNAIRCSHNPASKEMLDICDSLGMLVIDENRLMGINDEHLSLLRRMIERDRNHPSVMLWSIGNEEWWIESGERGEKIARRMTDYAHSIDDTRLCTYGNSGGFGVVKQVDIHGYNYIVQNDVDNRRQKYPDWFVIGTEETSGCGTRNVYVTDSVKGWMESINMKGEERSNGEKNVIERGWKFYRDNSWAGGLFYWTGFDYRGEPNPMVWPATGSQFGILDYCGFPKDEAYYLKAAWTDEPILHIFPHWNLKGMEGKQVEVWAYTNMDEVELLQNGKSLGRKKMEKDGHLVWTTTYRPGKLVAYGYKNGKRVMTEKVETTDAAESAIVKLSTERSQGGEADIIIADITLVDRKGRFVPDACNNLTVTVSEGSEILGWGNGDPGFKVTERPQGDNRLTAVIPAFMGHAQVIIKGNGTKVDVKVD